MKVLLELLDDAANALSKIDAIGELRPESRRRLEDVLEELATNSRELLDELEERAAVESSGDESRDEGRDELLERGLAAIAREQYEEAKSILEQGAVEHPGDAELLNHLGLACWESDDVAGAERAYARAMQAGLEQADRSGPNRCAGPPGDYLRALEGRALSLYRLEHFDRAVELFDTLATLAPESYGGCYYLAGEIRHLQESPDRAVEFYRRSPDEPSVYYNHGLALYEIGDRKRAARMLIRGFAANPHIAGRLLGRGSGEIAGPGGYLGSETYALEFLDACSQLWSDRNEALSFLEHCYEHPSVQTYLREAGSERSTGAEPVERDVEARAHSGGDGAPSDLDGLASEVVERRD